MAKTTNERKKARRQYAQASRRSAARKQGVKKMFAIVGVLALLLIGVGTVALSSSSSTTSTTTTVAADESAPTTASSLGGETIKGTTPCPATDGSSPRASLFEKVPPTCIDPKKSYVATFDTSEGTVVVNLDTKRTPETSNNFVVLANYHYYDGTKIFRTDPTIDIIQGGSPHTEDNSDAGPGYTIKDEGGKYTYSPGDLVMARTSQPNSASGQFFFVTGDNASNLNSSGTYVVFGHASQGLDVLKAIIGLNQEDPTTQSGAPSRAVTVTSVKITEN